MTDITPPPELVQELCDKAILHAVDGANRGEIEVWLIQEAFRAGADQELKACMQWLLSKGLNVTAPELRAARRPKPLSLKERALYLKKRALEELGPEPLPETGPTGDTILNKGSIDRHRTIRRALEALDD